MRIKKRSKKSLTPEMTNILENIPAVSTLKFIEPLIGLIVAVIGSLKLIAPDYIWLGALLLAIIVIIATAQPIIMCRYFEPQKKDTPIEALRKAKCSCASMAQVKLNNDDTKYFIYREKGNRVWIAPKIEYEWIAPSTIEEQIFMDCLNKDFDSADKPNYAGRLFKSVKQAVAKQQIKADWFQGGTAYKVEPLCTDSSNVKRLSISLKPIICRTDME